MPKIVGLKRVAMEANASLLLHSELSVDINADTPVRDLTVSLHTPLERYLVSYVDHDVGRVDGCETFDTCTYYSKGQLSGYLCLDNATLPGGIDCESLLSQTRMPVLMNFRPDWWMSRWHLWLQRQLLPVLLQHHNQYFRKVLNTLLDLRFQYRF